MKRDHFDNIINNTPNIVAVFKIARKSTCCKLWRLTNKDIFFYSKNDCLLCVQNNQQYNLPISSMKFIAYMEWDGKKLNRLCTRCKYCTC